MGCKAQQYRSAGRCYLGCRCNYCRTPQTWEMMWRWRARSHLRRCCSLSSGSGGLLHHAEEATWRGRMISTYEDLQGQSLLGRLLSRRANMTFPQR